MSNINPFAGLAGLQTSTLALPANPNITDELGRAGASFGKLVELTGLAVADTQTKLSQTSAQTASTLANTKVDVIAVQETIFDDQGNIQDGQTFVRTLPLVNFVDPVFYEWTQVRLQGQFFAQEIAAETTQRSNNSQSRDSTSQGGFLVILGGGATRTSGSTSSTTQTNTSTDDFSFGRIRAYAQLNPKTDVGVPKPRQIIQGPSLAIIEGAITDVVENARIVARTASALVELRRRDGTPIPNKAVSIETDGVPWNFTTAQQTTDAQGRVSITLRREFLDDQADRNPIDVVVTARLGLVSNSTTMRF